MKNTKAICKVCGKEFMTHKNKFCSPTCRNIDTARRKAESITGVENIDYVICRWCGMKAKRLYLGHFKTHHPGKTSEDYKKEFPDAPLACKTDNMNIAQGYVRYSQSDKGRKELSERVLGCKNPNSNINASEQDRKERSPFSKEFYKKRGFSDDESTYEVKSFAKEALKDRITSTQLEYWIRKTDGDEDLARELLHKRQVTFSLDRCIERLGKEEGIKRWNDRQELWKSKIFNNDTCIAVGTSKISVELFNKVKNETTMSEFYIRNSEECYVYDIRQGNRLIEFNGDFWHCNPEFFKEDYIHPIKKQTAKQIWEHDSKKIEAAKNRGFIVMTIWEKEYKEHSDDVIKKCIEFLNE